MVEDFIYLYWDVDCCIIQNEENVDVDWKWNLLKIFILLVSITKKNTLILKGNKRAKWERDFTGMVMVLGKGWAQVAKSWQRKRQFCWVGPTNMAPISQKLAGKLSCHRRFPHQNSLTPLTVWLPSNRQWHFVYTNVLVIKLLLEI